MKKRLSIVIKKSQKTGKCQDIAEGHMINRNYYLKQLIEKKHSSKIKIVTGLPNMEVAYTQMNLFDEE